MATPFLGELRIFSFNYPPKGWTTCNGQLLPINQYQALFAILGTTYGGNGTTNFALPNLQGSVPLHVGPGFVLGQIAGEAAHTLLLQEMPAHNHLVYGSSTPANLGAPAGNLWAVGDSTYTSSSNTSMNPAGIGSNGGNQTHENRPPYLTVNICIALTGIFPSRS